MNEADRYKVERTTFQYGRGDQGSVEDGEIPEGIEISLTKVASIPYFEMIVNGDNLGVADNSMNIIDIAVKHVQGKLAQ